MFNPDIKTQYIRQGASISVRKARLSLFSATEPYETKAGKDVCQMNTDELQRIINDIAGVRVVSRKRRLIMIREYIQWCVETKIPGADAAAAKTVNFAGSDGMAKRTVKSPFHLQSYLDLVFLPEAEETTDNILRCFLWLAYGGVPFDQSVFITAKEIDFSDMVIRHEGVEYPMYREGIRAFRNCTKLTAFKYKHAAYFEDAVKERRPGKEILRGIGDESADGETTLHHLSNRLAIATRSAVNNGKTSIRLNYQTAWYSGFYYRMHQMEISGMPITPHDLDISEKGGAAHKSTKKNAIRDYENWKLTL